MRTTPAFLVAACWACGGTGKDPAAAPSEPELVTFDASTASVSPDALALAMPWQLNNPLGQAVTVARIQWQLQAGDLQARGDAHPGTSIPAGATVKDAFVATVPLAPDHQGRTTPYSVAATFDVSDGREVSQFEAEWHGTTVLPQLPTLTLEPQAGRHGSDSIELNFVVGITNANGFDMRIDRLDHRVVLDGVQVGEGTLVQDHRLRAASTLEFQIGRVVTLKELPTKNLRAGPLRYNTEVNATLDGRTVTRTFEGDLTFER